MYHGTSLLFVLPIAHNPIVTAGLMWQPEIEPIAYAAHNRLRPNAIDTPRTPTDHDGPADPRVARIPVAGPPTTRMSVPTASASAIRCCWVITCSLRRRARRRKAVNSQ